MASSTIGWRPPQWVNNAPPLTILGPSLNGQLGSVPVLYAFDSAGRAQHDQELVITKNPVQTGAAIGDHSYLQPAQLSVEIWMSDLMQSYVVGQFSGAPSRSVSAFQTLLALQMSGQFLQVATRLRLYNNMLIRSISDSDTIDTRFGLVCNVVFEEVILADATQFTPGSSILGSSARPQTTGNTQSGQTQTSPVPQQILTLHNINNYNGPAIITPGLTPPPQTTVQNAGDYSSTNLYTLEGLAGPQ